MASGNEIALAAYELMQLQPGSATLAVARTAGGIAVIETGKIVFKRLVEPVVDDMFERLRKAKEEGCVRDDFESTPHGMRLMQEAWNVLKQGLDEERAEAVKKMFLGLAMNPVNDSLERIEQLELLRITSELEAWEVALINAIERYRKSHFDEQLANSWDNTNSPERRNQIKSEAQIGGEPLQQWMQKSVCGSDSSRFRSLELAYESLKKKDVFSGEYRVLSDAYPTIKFRRHCPFTGLGAKLVAHLYSAKLDD